MSQKILFPSAVEVFPFNSPPLEEKVEEEKEKSP